jgi:(R,R)-butanediol dehydrogenase/meso-butanediol dehydrogenase/diacetyl reductase/L-iditol 2-dehydrogenase
VVECSGSPRAVYDLPFIVAKGGFLLYAAMYPGDFEMPLNLFQHCYFNEITITGMYVAPYAYPRAAAMLPRMQLEDFTSKVFYIDDCEEAFKAQISGKYPKILIECNKL